MTCECCDYEEVNVGWYQCVNDDCDPVGAVLVDVFDYGEIVLPANMPFSQRAKMLPPPRVDYVMFADSAPDINVPHLLAQGISPEKICITRMGEADAVWHFVANDGEDSQ